MMAFARRVLLLKIYVNEMNTIASWNRVEINALYKILTVKTLTLT